MSHEKNVVNAMEIDARITMNSGGWKAAPLAIQHCGNVPLNPLLCAVAEQNFINKLSILSSKPFL